MKRYLEKLWYHNKKNLKVQTAAISIFFFAFLSYYLLVMKLYYPKEISRLLFSIFGTSIIVVLLLINKYFFFKKEFINDHQYKRIKGSIAVLAVGFLFIVGGLYGYRDFSALDTNFQTQDKQLLVMANPKTALVLNNFRFSYGLKEKQGSLIFNAKRRDQRPIENFVINLPDGLRVESIDLFEADKLVEEGKSYTENIFGDSRIVLNDFDESLDDIDFLIKVSDGFNPNGRFYIEANAWRVYSDNEKVVKLNLKDIWCKGQCGTGLSNSEIIQEGDNLFVKYPADYYEVEGARSLYTRFSLSTINKPGEEGKAAVINIMLGLILSGFVLFGDFIRRLLEVILAKF